MNQQELRWTLCTSDLKVARKHLLIATVLIHELFERIDMQTSHEPLTDREKIWLKNRIEEIKLEKMAEFRALIRQGQSGITRAEALLTSEQGDIDAFQSAIDSDHYDAMAVKGPASQLIPVVDRLAYDFSALNQNYNFVAKAFCSAMVVHHRNKQAALKDASLREAPGPSIQVVQSDITQPEAAPQSAHASAKISEVIEAYIGEQQAKGCQDKTAIEYRSVLRRFQEFKDDCPIDKVTRSDVRAYRDALAKYPARPSTAQRKMSFQQLTASAAAQPLNVASVNKHLTRLSQLFKWAERNGHNIKGDTAEDHQLKDKRRERDLRNRFSQEDINTIFSTPLYQGQKPFQRAAQYWAPLLGLYAGMRIEEVCQLRVCDVRIDHDSNIAIIDINDEDDDRKLKPGDNTPRQLPVHSKLIELGLMDYANDLRAKKHRMLFPTLNRHPKNGWSHAVTKWFSEYKKALGLPLTKVFHSFRHTVDDILKQSETEEAIINGVMGHTGKNSISIQRYGKDYLPKILAPRIEKIQFDMPAKPFRSCEVSQAEKSALQSPRAAAKIRQRRLEVRAGVAVGPDQE